MFGETGIDFITDFDPQQDQFHLVGFSAKAELAFVQLAQVTVLSVDNDKIPLLNNVDQNDIVIGENILFCDELLI
ncbi:hypothetical protein [uncultured Roseobacter sp.]|uniref:hypothetical protein n=1 Tax=uncultured Roseobacter sp. TaxID=114847 RepID=UPI00260249C1|nr:hypothetical protein [uncultured Roseobacter sp.]